MTESGQLVLRGKCGDYSHFPGEKTVADQFPQKETEASPSSQDCTQSFKKFSKFGALSFA